MEEQFNFFFKIPVYKAALYTLSCGPVWYVQVVFGEACSNPWEDMKSDSVPPKSGVHTVISNNIGNHAKDMSLCSKIINYNLVL